MDWWLGAMERLLGAISCSHSLGDQLVKRFNKDALPAPLFFGLHGVNDFGRLKDLGVPPLASPNLPWKTEVSSALASLHCSK